MRAAFLLLLMVSVCFTAAATDSARAAVEERETAGFQGSPPGTPDKEKDDGMMTTPFGKIRRIPPAATEVPNGLTDRGKTAGDGYEIVQTPFGPVKRGITNQGKDRE